MISSGTRRRGNEIHAIAKKMLVPIERYFSLSRIRILGSRLSLVSKLPSNERKTFPPGRKEGTYGDDEYRGGRALSTGGEGREGDVKVESKNQPSNVPRRMIDSAVLYGILLAIYSPFTKGKENKFAVVARRGGGGGGRENKSFEIGFNSVRNSPLKKHAWLSIVVGILPPSHCLCFHVIKVSQRSKRLASRNNRA